ncbi:MAG: discoidin domain-containing protein, partial [Clostridia bacterium]|nr:discoidin domain-containing protein [Clostridia bacterium]
LRPDVTVNGNTVDLGGEYEISRVRFTCSGGGFALSVSCDGENWNEIESSPITAEGCDFDLPPVSARYVRLDGNVKAIEIFGK